MSWKRLLQVLCVIRLGLHDIAPASAAVGTSKTTLHPGHPHAVQRAEFVLRELQELSDTGIYRTLSLKRISEAWTQDGAFHYNTVLTVELASPYFSSGQREERFEIAVMESKEDGHVSFTIDSFPEMDAEATEDFYIQQVEQHRQRRTLFMSRVDREADGDSLAVAHAGTSDPARLAVDMMSRDDDELMVLVEQGGDAETSPLRKAVDGELERRSTLNAP